MATRDTYTTQTWENLPSETTPVNAERLLHIEQGIKNVADKRALKEIYDDDSINLGRAKGTTVGNHSTAEGEYVTASGNCSHAEGNGTKASGIYSHAEGYSTSASGSSSHAEGYQTTSFGNFSHSEGRGTNASAPWSHAEGLNTTALGEAQHVSGKYNATDATKVVIVGWGTSDSDRKNIHTIDRVGNAYFAGDVSNGAGVSLNSLRSSLETISDIASGASAAKVFDTKAELDEWIAVEGNAETLKTGQNIYIKETETPDYWWDGTGLQVLETDKVVVESLTYDETMSALDSRETGETNKIPNVYAIRDWCKSMLNPTEGA